MMPGAAPLNLSDDVIPESTDEPTTISDMGGQLPFVNIYRNITGEFSWVTSRLDFSALKPVIRSSVSAWICLILIVVPHTQRAMGNASFLVLIGAALSPANEPFIAIVQRELNILFAVALAWAWSVLGIKCASLARSEVTTAVTTEDIFQGRYVELAPNVIMALFLAFGAAFFVYLKARLGPGPYVYATVFGCITIDICLTTASLFPYPYYQIGQLVMVPLAVHSAVSTACSVLIFPETLNAQFAKRLRAVLLPLSKAVRIQPELLFKSPLTPDFDPSEVKDLVSQAEGALLPLRASGQLLKRDLSFGRLSGKDLRDLQDFARRLTIRADGLSFFYRIIDPLRDHFPQTPAISRGVTPLPSAPTTPVESRPHTPEQLLQHISSPLASPAAPATEVEVGASSGQSGHLHQLNHHHRNHHHHHRRLRIGTPSILHEKLHQASENEVGMFEMQRYMNIEANLQVPHGDQYVHRAVSLLGGSTAALLTSCADSLDCVIYWLERLNAERFRIHRTELDARSVVDTRATIEKALKLFKVENRFEILKPYVTEEGHLASHSPPHRYLFQCFVYQFHLLEFAEILVDLLSEIIRLDDERHIKRLWPPTMPWKTFLSLVINPKVEYEGDVDDDEDPDTVSGIIESPQNQETLNDSRTRDPDALPPTNYVELVGMWAFAGISAIGKGNILFAVKSGILSILISLPVYMGSSASWAYQNKWVWAIIMSQLTTSRFKGDTAFAFFYRIVATIIGGVVGMAVWYISAGSGRGNSYGLAATTAAFFPFVMFFRIYYPGPPITTLVTVVTIFLVVGYSWQDTHQPAPSSPGYGFDIAWRRFVFVTVGVTAAFFFSFLPPSTTIRRYHRLGQATTALQLGNIFCDIISLASTGEKKAHPELVKNLILIRSKLRKNKAQSRFVTYELSLRGKWPASRHAAVSNLQLEIAYLLSHVYTVVTHLDDTWAQAFLQRTRLLDPDFLGSVLSIISLCSSSLRNGTPMPQITPAPLIDRFLVHQMGLNVVPPQAELDYGLPKLITAETLRDEQYMCFSVGATSVYGIITRLDRLTLAVKELVGENFHVDGVQLHVSHLPV